MNWQPIGPRFLTLSQSGYEKSNFQERSGVRTLFLIFSLLCVLVSLAPIAWADFEASSGELRMHAQSFQDAGSLQANTKTIAVIALATLVLGIVALGIWSSTSSRKAAKLMGLSQGLSAQNLFLGVHYSDGEQKETMGYFRSLDLREATFVSNRDHPRGEDLRFNLVSLPGFPSASAGVLGQVVTCRSLGGSPESYLVAVRFQDVSDQTKDSLGKYIRELTKRSSAFSRA